MLNQLYAITIKELKSLLKDRPAISALFLLPIIFVVIMTYAGVGNQGVKSANVLFLNEDQGPVAARIIDKLRHDPGITVQTRDGGQALSRAQAEALLVKRGSNLAFIVVFPSDFSAKLAGGAAGNADVRFILDPATGGQNLLPFERLIKIAVLESAGRLGTAHFATTALDQLTKEEVFKAIPEHAKLHTRFAASLTGIDTKVADKVVFKEVVPASWQDYHPVTPKDQNVPGYTIFGVFFIVQVIGNTILREKESGTFNRLLTAPIDKPVLLLGKLIPFYFVNMVQVLVLLTFGYLVFHIRLGSSPLGLFVVTLATSAAANALGLLIASISKSAEQMGPLSGVILIILATCGGILIPYFEMPDLLQHLAFFTPHAWALKGYQDILVRGYDFYSVLPSVGALLAFALVFYSLALLKFRFE